MKIVMHVKILYFKLWIFTGPCAGLVAWDPVLGCEGVNRHG